MRVYSRGWRYGAMEGGGTKDHGRGKRKIREPPPEHVVVQREVGHEQSSTYVERGEGAEERGGEGRERDRCQLMASRCGSRGVERANTTPPSGLAEEASARWCRTRRLGLSLPASSIKPCPASALPPSPGAAPRENHFRACYRYTPFQGD